MRNAWGEKLIEQKFSIPVLNDQEEKIMIKIDIYIDLSQSNISICFKKIFVVKEKCAFGAIKNDTSIYL